MDASHPCGVIEHRFGDIKMELSVLLLRCFECGKPVDNGDLQVTGRLHGVTGYFHPDCWEKYQSEHEKKKDCDYCRSQGKCGYEKTHVDEMVPFTGNCPLKLCIRFSP